METDKKPPVDHQEGAHSHLTSDPRKILSGQTPDQSLQEGAKKWVTGTATPEKKG